MLLSAAVLAALYTPTTGRQPRETRAIGEGRCRRRFASSRVYRQQQGARRPALLGARSRCLAQSTNALEIRPSAGGGRRAAPAGHESQLAYGSPVFAAGGIPISNRYPLPLG
jgi:hypothetical protein